MSSAALDSVMARRFYWIDPFSYAQKAIAINEFDTPRWHAVTTPAGEPLGLTILDQKALPHERWWIWCAYLCCTPLSGPEGPATNVGESMRFSAYVSQFLFFLNSKPEGPAAWALVDLCSSFTSNPLL